MIKSDNKTDKRIINQYMIRQAHKRGIPLDFKMLDEGDQLAHLYEEVKIEPYPHQSSTERNGLLTDGAGEQNKNPVYQDLPVSATNPVKVRPVMRTLVGSNYTPTEESSGH